ncbi:helix-turn-helix domain-containing protein [Sporosarcina limicola]|uniref:Transcriptional regulator with XRE-family HTH domain n=1 Tax=Sporosarcina limicola TaxID=34101 RepID=A0A927RFN0_9BACL|nr:helix-turn-helix transcriptional regulator [Sporosarcina limicola]MBE1555677.1 transcriptional regulator with XRE-family HTH domain [Sporosarcina limicola]
MHFGKQFKEYREEYLRMKQLEAALELNIEPAALSNYERNERGFPNDLLPIVKETFDIPNDYFLAMVLGDPLKSVRNPEVSQPIKALEVKERYMDSFIDRHRQLFEDSAELREFVTLASTLTEKDRRIFLNSNKSLLTLIHKHSRE